MGKIVLLDDLTINKIAAGEVIERPASVVKEMVENSIDAGAKNITVEIKNGGISLIRIIDDGCGIAEDDMEIAFERHATSKIRKADDLETVKTMGFRGEALASVASIANVEMISKRAEDEIGHKLVIEGGKVLEQEEVGTSNGTQITVKNLFYNTPVRYKFLKKDFTEAGYIEDAITRIALANKDVAIKLVNTGKTVIQTNGSGDTKTLIYSLYGKDVAEGITEVEYEYEDMKVTGIIGKPENARGTRAYQQFFVNNRYVRDKNLSAAVDNAYKGLVPAGKFGFVILNLEIDPKKVDVNVHPAKLEVRFEDDGKVFKAIYHAIKAGFAKFEAEAKADKIFPEEKDENQENKLEDETLESEEKKAVEEFKPRQNAFSGFFKKLLGNEDEEDEEEDDDDNSIKDIFEKRKMTKNRLYNDFNRTKNEDAIKEAGVTQDENGDIEPVLKLEEVKLGNTIISSDTRESDYNINDILKEETIKVDTTKVFDKSEGTKTEVIDTLKKVSETVSEETIMMDSINSSVNVEKTEASTEENLDDDNSKLNDVKDVENENKVQEKIENNKPIDNVTETILRMKMNSDIDDTQLIDTAKVRDGINDREEIPMTKEFANMYKKVFGTEVSSIRKTKEEESAKMDVSSSLQTAANSENLSVFENDDTYVPEVKYKYVGTIFDTYIIIEIKDEMYMIDKNAANERLVYEKVKYNYYNEEDKDSQMLLLADIVTLPSKKMSLARELKTMFNNAGFDFDEFGENTIKLVAVPGMCEEMNTKKLFIDILSEMDTVAVTEQKEKEDKFVATVACKTAAKDKILLDENSANSLVKKLLILPEAFVGPKGKPVAIKITRVDMEKKFSRR